jgi:ATP-dependent RNA helicase SUPV3L1/SUV3
VMVEGHYVGELQGFRFVPDVTASGDEAKTLVAAANRVLRSEIDARAQQLSAAPDAAFAVLPDGSVMWGGGAVARLAAGETPLTPRLEPLPGEFLEGERLAQVRRRLQLLVRDWLAMWLKPLFRARDAELHGPARGIAWQLAESLGSVPVAEVRSLVEALSTQDRKSLGRLGIRLGTEWVYSEPLLKPAAIETRALLWSIHRGASLPAPVPPPGRLSLEPVASPEFYAAIGYGVLGRRALRVDRIERLAVAARRLARQGAFTPTPELASLAGVKQEELPASIAALGYRAIADDAGTAFVARRRRSAPREKSRVAHGPFAALERLTSER